MSDILELSATEAIEERIDPIELWSAYRDRALADDLGALSWVSEDAAPPQTDGPLGGVPVGIKDLFCTEGVPSQAGSRILEGYRPPYTATSVRNLQAAGAPMLVKPHQY